MVSVTPRFALALPEIRGAVNEWGDWTNRTFEQIDQALSGVRTIDTSGDPSGSVTVDMSPPAVTGLDDYLLDKKRCQTVYVKSRDGQFVSLVFPDDLEASWFLYWNGRGSVILYRGDQMYGVLGTTAAFLTVSPDNQTPIRVSDLYAGRASPKIGLANGASINADTYAARTLFLVPTGTATIYLGNGAVAADPVRGTTSLVGQEFDAYVSAGATLNLRFPLSMHIDSTYVEAGVPYPVVGERYLRLVPVGGYKWVRSIWR